MRGVIHQLAAMALAGAVFGLSAAAAQDSRNGPPAVPVPTPDPTHQLVAQLDLVRYKATIRGLAEFGDRRQGTDRNRAAIDWIEARLQSYGCATERMQYEYTGQQLRPRAAGAPPAPPRATAAPRPAAPSKGFRARTGVNTDSMAQPDARLRALNAQPDTPGPREQVYCTKTGTTHPGEMYIVSAHMDGHGFGEAANDDASGTAIVMELARILSAPGVETERSIRFILWNNEETGLNGSRAYIAQREALQGRESPAGSGRFPEPRWLGIVQHDMMLFDHGMPRADGTVAAVQRPEADVNIEFAGASKLADESQRLAWLFRRANDRYATDYPAAVGDRMSNTDSAPFAELIPAISLRENERLAHIGTGWNPHWHQPSDLFRTFQDDDFRLGLNAAQTTLAAIAQLAGASIRAQ